MLKYEKVLERASKIGDSIEFLRQNWPLSFTDKSVNIIMRTVLILQLFSSYHSLINIIFLFSIGDFTCSRSRLVASSKWNGPICCA